MEHAVNEHNEHLRVRKKPPYHDNHKSFGIWWEYCEQSKGASNSWGMNLGAHKEERGLLFIVDDACAIKMEGYLHAWLHIK